MTLGFEIIARDGRARAGRLITRRGPVPTPVFMPVATQGAVKAMSPRDVREVGGAMVLANTYHLLLRPGVEVVRELGGLHRFMGWDGPILTDSGGFQVYSLAPLRRIEEEGVIFRSHLDGALVSLTPEEAIAAQQALGSDIMMVLDECPPAGAPRGYLLEALRRDERWARRAIKVWDRASGAGLMGIIQGGVDLELRAMSVELICALGLDGYALGGLSVGEPKQKMWEVIEATVQLLPQDKPVYLMGVGAPEDLVKAVGLGVDMFDCVLPTRMARTGTLLTSTGRINIKNARYARDERPVEMGCGCYTCRNFSRAYLRHLFMSRELLAYTLNTIHNLHYILGLMAGLRRAIEEGNYQAFARDVLESLAQGGAEADQGGWDA